MLTRSANLKQGEWARKMWRSYLSPAPRLLRTRGRTSRRLTFIWRMMPSWRLMESRQCGLRLRTWHVFSLMDATSWLLDDQVVQHTNGPHKD